MWVLWGGSSDPGPWEPLMPRRLASLLASLVVGLVAVAGLSTPASAVAPAPTVRISTPWMVKARVATTLKGTVSAGSGHAAYLQIASGSSWKNLKKTTVRASGTKGTFSFRFVPRSSAHSYRVVVKKPGVRTAVSNTRVIRTTTGSVYLAKARHYMKRYCPATPIKADLPRGAALAGRADTSYRWTGVYTSKGLKKTYTWKQKIRLQPGMPDATLRAVSLHECAHIVQYRQLRKGEDYLNARIKATDKLHHGNGIEKQADCMTAVLLGTMRYAAYTNTCTSAQKKAAKALWKSFGSKYQKATYTFTRYE